MNRTAAASLDGCFQALAHPIRRAMLERLRRGPATVGDLAAPFRVSPPAISKHLRVLEEAGLVQRERLGNEHHVALRADPLLDAAAWLGRYSRFWQPRLDALEGLVAELEAEGPPTHRKERRR